MDFKWISVIGGAGHVGLPFSLWCSKYINAVNIVDTNHEMISRLVVGDYPYEEHDSRVAEQLKKGNRSNLFYNNEDILKSSEVIVITIGTPLDEQNNPRTEDIINIMEELNSKTFTVERPLIILRSTVYPGFTRMLYEKYGERFGIVYAPERMSQNTGFKEIDAFPQLVGTTSDDFEKATAFFKTIGIRDVFIMRYKEAEYAKLVTNMYRYLNFAFANEIYKLGAGEGVDVHKLIEYANEEYPRMNMPLPGPNVGGPCLFKDGWFFTENENMSGSLMNMAFHINESMPAWIVKRIEENFPYSRKLAVCILGATFKAGSDDTRNSLSFKLKKICEQKGWVVSMIDPYIDEKVVNRDFYPEIASDVVVLMTPHEEFDYDFFNDIPDGTLIVDIWKHFPQSESEVTGIYTKGDNY